MAKATRFSEVYEELEDVWAIDTHEHIGNAFIGSDSLEPVTDTLQKDLIDLLLGIYVRTELISAGMNPKMLIRLYEDKQRDPEEAMSEIFKYLPYIEGTSVYKALFIGLRELHGFDETRIDKSNWRSLSERIKEAYENGVYTWWEKVFAQVKVEKALRTVRLSYFKTYRPRLAPFCEAIDSRLFVPVSVIDSIISQSPYPTEVLSSQLEVALETLDDYIEYMHRAFRYFKDNGVVGLKVTLAYSRRLDFDKVSRKTAEDVFKIPPKRRSAIEQKIFQDFIMEEVVLAAIELGLPIQFHTGLREGAVGIIDTNPAYIERFISRKEFSNARFVLLHGGFPYMGEVTLLARNLPNVYIDFCWSPILSYHATKEWLAKWIQMVPANKIMVGGDVFSVEHFYGAMKLTRRIVTEVLSNFVEEGHITPKQAILIGKLILRENAKSLFRLGRG